MQCESAVRDFDSRHGRHFADDVAQRLFEGKSMHDDLAATTFVFLT